MDAAGTENGVNTASGHSVQRPSVCTAPQSDLEDHQADVCQERAAQHGHSL